MLINRFKVVLANLGQEQLLLLVALVILQTIGLARLPDLHVDWLRACRRAVDDFERGAVGEMFW